METFDTTIVEAQRGGALVHVPPEVVTALGGGGRIRVRATFDGVPYRGSVVSMGGAEVLGMLKSIRSRLGKEPGDVVRVTLEPELQERSVTVPDDLAAALDAAALADRFADLSYSHRREYVTWIEQAKRPATRSRRIDETIERLRA